MKLQPAFYSDREVAALLGMSMSWVRVQRHKRRNGLEHVLPLEPRYIGSAVRYARADVEAFAASISERV